MLWVGVLLASGKAGLANAVAIAGAVAIIPAFVLDRRYLRRSQPLPTRSFHPVLLQVASTILTMIAGGAVVVGGYFVTSLGFAFTGLMTVLSWVIVQGAFVIQRAAVLSTNEELGPARGGGSNASASGT